MTKRKIQYWVIPPKANSEFVANMEEVLETYARPYDAAFPVLCMDEQFSPEKARSILQRLSFCYTPKHGSWLNVAENELSSLTRQCLSGRRIPSFEMLCEETAAWSSACNSKQRGVDWQFTIGDARQKLKSLYPKIIV